MNCENRPSPPHTSKPQEQVPLLHTLNQSREAVPGFGLSLGHGQPRGQRRHDLRVGEVHDDLDVLHQEARLRPVRSLQRPQVVPKLRERNNLLPFLRVGGDELVCMSCLFD